MYTTKSYITKNEAKSVELPDSPSDSVSCVSFNPENTHVAVASWDGSLKLYRLPYYPSSASNCTLEKNYPLGVPVTACCFFNNMLLAGLSDGTLVAVESGNKLQAHDNLIKGMFNYNNQFVITGSFDRTIKFWDLKTVNAVHVMTLPDKIYAMDLKEDLLVIALAGKSIMVYNVSNINHPLNVPSKFSYSLRSVSAHKDQDTFAVGGIEARVEIFSRSAPAKTTVFRCHRSDNKLYSVNVTKLFPPDSRLMVTGGADGTLVWFDRDNRTKMCTNEFGSPITAGEFSNDGKYFIFGIGNDWSRGYTGGWTKTSLRMIVVSSVPGVSK